MSNQKKISIHLNSNKPESFKEFINSIKATAFNIKDIEVLVSIDKNDIGMIKVIESINDSDNLIRYIETSLIKSFSDAWKPLNTLLQKTSKSVYFISCVSDDLRFITKNWDKIILSYENHYKDDILRIRCSKYRNEVYKDIWECGYKPDSYSFYTKKWLEIVGKWNPCIGPDTFQECISYYLNNYGKPYQRNIVNNIIQFKGEEVSTDLNFKERLSRTRIYYKAFFTLMSYKNQKRASEAAYKIVTKISEVNNVKTRMITINPSKIYFTNLSRRFNFFYYRGSPNHFINTKIKNILFIVWCYMSVLDKPMIIIINFLYNNNYLRKIIKDDKKLKQVESIINRG